MNGTGTNTDPYQITTIAEFRSMSDNTAYYKLMNDIDASYYNGGVWTAVTIAFRDFNGNGHKISNINYNGTSSAITIACNNTVITKMYNTTFENFVYVGNNKAIVTTGTVYNCYFNCSNCVFNIDYTQANNTNVYIFDFGQSAVQNCTFSIKAYKYGYGILYAGYSAYGLESVLCCAFYIDLTVYGTISANIITCGSTGTYYVSKTFIRGKITATSGATQGIGYIFNMRAINSYFAIEFSNINNIYSHYKKGGNCFYDTSIKGSTVISKGASSEGDVDFYALTTAQCKDTDYLQSIGFPVRWQT